MTKALVLYFSKSGHTKRMAEAISEGLTANGIEVTLHSVAEAKLDDLPQYDALVLGSPCYYGSMAAELKAFLDHSVKFHGKLTGKIGGAFTSSGMLGGGNETTLMSLIQALLIHGMIVQGHARMAHYGPVAVGDPDSNILTECQQYGKALGELAQKMGAV